MTLEKKLQKLKADLEAVLVTLDATLAEGRAEDARTTFEMVELIKREAAIAYSVDSCGFQSRSRKQPLSRARQAAMRAVRERLGLGLAEIGGYFGPKNNPFTHGTVSHAVAAVDTNSLEWRRLWERLDGVLAPALTVTTPEEIFAEVGTPLGTPPATKPDCQG